MLHMQQTALSHNKNNLFAIAVGTTTQRFFYKEKNMMSNRKE